MCKDWVSFSRNIYGKDKYPYYYDVKYGISYEDATCIHIRGKGMNYNSFKKNKIEKIATYGKRVGDINYSE